MGRDVHADAIVTKAKDTHVPLGDRAVEAVKSIVRAYYDESMLSGVVYDENEGGLSTTPVGRGSDIKGKITVGKYFHLPDAQRRDTIDAALRYFNCLGEDDKSGFAEKKAELLRQREGVNGTRGNASTQPPTQCRRAN
jgi:hypothetical protein